MSLLEAVKKARAARDQIDDMPPCTHATLADKIKGPCGAYKRLWMCSEPFARKVPGLRPTAHCLKWCNRNPRREQHEGQPTTQRT